MEQEGDIILEMVTIGNAVKVTAVHAVTGTEVSFMAPRNTSILSLKMMAKKKLQYVMNKNNQS